MLRLTGKANGLQSVHILMNIGASFGLLRSWCLFLLLAAAQAQTIDSSKVKSLFSTPPREYATAPLWVWNDQLTEEQVASTLRDLHSQNVRQVFVHPRPGLMTPYLSADWFRLWKHALSVASKLDMNVWIYDENSYPSGFAGGWVPELMPESRGRGLFFEESNSAPAWKEGSLAVFQVENGVEDVTKQVRSGESLSAGKYLTAQVRRAGNSPWHGDRCYVDLLYPGVTEKFLEITMGAYKKNLGSEFGKRIPGVFTDEPNIAPAGGLPWTEDLPAQFEKRWGYSLLANLPSLTKELGDWRKVRHNYFCLLNELFIERFGKPYYDYCAANQLEFTGHYWDHEWPNCVGVPDNMAMAAWQQRPGIDCLMNRFSEDTHSQFGNIRFCREISSVANQMGRQRTLVELYGAGGWDLRFQDMKRIADWLMVLGINTLDEHLSYITLRGARKRDHPQSFSYHEPWWGSYHEISTYATRLCAALSQGEQINQILVIEPTTTAWMYQGNGPQLKKIGVSFFDCLKALESAQIEYDLGCEDMIIRWGATASSPNSGKPMKKTPKGRLRVGERVYSTVVLPPGLQNMDRRAMQLIRESGCRILGENPKYLDGSPVGSANTGDTTPSKDINSSLVATLLPVSHSDGFKIQQSNPNEGILFHQRRKLKDGELVFLVNTSDTDPSQGTITSGGKGVELWDPHSGEIQRCAFSATESGVKMDFSLPPCGSQLLFFAKSTRKPNQSRESTVTLHPLDAPKIKRLAPNVLTLDYLDVSVGRQSRTNSYFYPAAQFAFQQNGMARNPWDSAVQFRDEIIRKTFAADSGLTAVYHFKVKDSVPSDLQIVIESPELYAVSCNGSPLQPEPGQWWLDKAFGVYRLSAVARLGDNEVKLVAKPFTIRHELEPAYLLGSFRLQTCASGFEVCPASGLQLGSWRQQGLPFYAQGVVYKETFQVDAKTDRARVRLGKWYGSVAKVTVNGKPAGNIYTAPWTLDVSSLIKKGENTVEVSVVGTLKNTLGPHHGNPGVGSAWPGMWHQAPNPGPPPGANYHTLDYGLWEPFTLEMVSLTR
jgi:hypothetical protein